MGAVLDYGCGRGDDVARFNDAGMPAVGWDPHYRPAPPPKPADTVFCSYVLNVLPTLEQRQEVLRRAWDLTQRVLILAVRDTRERSRVDGVTHADGILTGARTFHHLFAPTELRGLTETTLGVRATPVDPGLVYVFRRAEDRLRYLSRRHAIAEVAGSQQHVLERLIGTLHVLGRQPLSGDNPELFAEVTTVFGSPSAALRIALGEADRDAMELAKRCRMRELIVLLALERFYGERRFPDLPYTRRVDCRVFFTSFKTACREADRALLAAGNPERIREAVRRSRVGKQTQSALYVHTEAERFLPATLQVYAACADVAVGRPTETNLLKFHFSEPAVSFLSYPTFHTDPHPVLARSLAVNLRSREAAFIDWSGRQNRPLLHRKEEFLHPSHPRFALYRRLTVREIQADLYRDPSRIGMQEGWESVLAERGLRLAGHRLVSAETAPA